MFGRRDGVLIGVEQFPVGQLVFALLESERLVPGFEEAAAKGHAIEQGRGYPGIPEDAYPFGEGQGDGRPARSFRGAG